IAVSAGPIAEVLRAAAELEMPLIRAVAASVTATDPDGAAPEPAASVVATDPDGATPEPAAAAAPLARALHAVVAAAPMLAECTVSVVPAIGLRGRVLDRQIFVGMPGI